MQSVPTQSETFSLSQVFVVLSIVIVSAIVILFSLDPIIQVRSARNRQRWSEMNTIASALRAYHNFYGKFPSGIDRKIATVQIIGESVSGHCEIISCGDDQVASVGCNIPRFREEMRPFIRPIPYDPLYGSLSNAQYYVNVDYRGSVYVGACREEPEDVRAKSKPPKIEVTF